MFTEPLEYGCHGDFQRFSIRYPNKRLAVANSPQVCVVSTVFLRAVRELRVLAQAMANSNVAGRTKDSHL